ncbi:hypothetical protein [Campylobacter concisus]|nr:hypothetical protein [Campylobacter concisus]
MKTKTRDSVIVASIKGSISLHVRVVRSKKTYTRKQKHPKDNRRST